MAFGGFNDNSHQAPMAEINVTPMVDVMLVLLVIPLILSLKADGTLYFGRTPINLQKIGETLNVYPKSKQIVLSADSGIILEKFVRVVDEIKRNGYPHVSLQVEKSDPSA